MPERANKFAFTDRRLERLKPEATRRCYYDIKCPGLELRVSTSGYKVFSFVGPRGLRERIGQFPPLTVKLAREIANEKRLCVELCISPVQRETLGTLWEKYREDLIRRKCHEDTVKRFGRRFRYLEPWKHRRLDRISLDMVRDLQRRLKQLGMHGLENDVICLLRAMTNFAKRRGWVGKSPVLGLPRSKKRVRDRFIEPHELFGFISTLEERQDVFGDLVLFALFTGVRRHEAEHAKWRDFQLALKRWSFIGNKTERHRTVYLSDYVLAILARRKSQVTPGAEYVFANPFTDRPLGWVRRVMYRAEMAARGLPVDTLYLSVKNEFSMHTLRHSFSTYAHQAGIPMHMVQKMIGHNVHPRLKLAVFDYSHSTADWECEAFQKVADIIQRIAREARPKNVAPEAQHVFFQSKPPTDEQAPPPGAVTAEGAAALLAAQKAAYLWYFRAKAARPKNARPEVRSESSEKELPGQPAIQHMVALKNEGKSTHEIARIMTACGYKTGNVDVCKILSAIARDSIAASQKDVGDE